MLRFLAIKSYSPDLLHAVLMAKTGGWIIHEAGPRFTEKMPWTDEATFETNGIVN
jgi:hypothetical protein